MKTAPYVIRRIQLENLPGKDDLATAPGNGYLFSCWWRDVPMAQFFLDHQVSADAGLPAMKILDAVEPAFKQYLQAEGPAMDYRRALWQQQHTDLIERMDAALVRYTGEPPAQVDVSIVICTRNRPLDLQRCLGSIAMQACQPREIIVVDNAPDDDATLRLTEQYPDVIYCREPRGGLSIARNTGIRHATGSIVAFTDDDVCLHPHWLFHLWHTFEQPGIQAMTGLVMPATLDTESQQLFEKEWSFYHGCCDLYFDSKYFQASLTAGPRVWEIGAGANMAFRRTIFEKAGYFDERLGAGAAGCSEDSEMWYRLLAAGMPIQYNPRAVVYHEHRSDKAGLHRQLFSYMRGHAAAALIQQQQMPEAGYRRYLYRKVVKTYLPLLVKTAFRHPSQCRLLLLQVQGIFSGVLFFIRNRHKPPQTNVN